MPNSSGVGGVKIGIEKYQIVVAVELLDVAKFMQPSIASFPSAVEQFVK